MKNLLKKELRLAASPLAYVFLAGALITLLPGYPILLSAFFICFGLFHSFQNAREANDTLYSVLLPIPKTAFVSAKYAFVCLIQMIGLVLCSLLTVLRMTVLSGGEAYVNNALMNPSPVFLSLVLLIFTAFNLLFVGGFFKTGYKIGGPFLLFGVSALLLVSIGEALHYLPGLAFLNTTTGERIGMQLCVLAAAALVYAICTVLSWRVSKARFAQIDL